MPQPRRSVLGVGNDEVDLVAFDDGRQPVTDEIAPRPAHDVADEEQSGHG